MARLEGKKVAIIATDGFEQAELVEPKAALEKEGATVDVVSLEKGDIQGYEHFEKGDAIRVDRTIADADAKDYDAMVLPGGVHNPDALRTDDDVLRFVKDIFADSKPVGVICHGGWTLIDAGVVEGRTMTSVKSIRTDLRNAGANVVDQEVVVDKGLVSSRLPKDLPAFCAKLVEEIAEGRHTGREPATIQPSAAQQAASKR
jgi:protease I